MTQRVLHVDFVSLSPGTGPDDRDQLIEAAAGLSALSQVVRLGAIEAEAGSEFDLVFYFVLGDFAALEPFGTDERYSRFLQGEVAPRLRRFAGADVRLEDEFVAEGTSGAVMALMAAEETYDWEVREALQAWAEQTKAPITAVGLAVGERQLYRGVALMFGQALKPASKPDSERFRATLVSGRARTLA